MANKIKVLMLTVIMLVGVLGLTGCSDGKTIEVDPNYYELFEIEPISDMQNDSGTITIRATIDYKDGGFNGGDKRLYYAASSDKIAFSAKSIADAQKKLK